MKFILFLFWLSNPDIIMANNTHLWKMISALCINWTVCQMLRFFIFFTGRQAHFAQMSMCSRQHLRNVTQFHVSRNFSVLNNTNKNDKPKVLFFRRSLISIMYKHTNTQKWTLSPSPTHFQSLQPHRDFRNHTSVVFSLLRMLRTRSSGSVVNTGVAGSILCSFVFRMKLWTEVQFPYDLCVGGCSAHFSSTLGRQPFHLSRNSVFQNVHFQIEDAQQAGWSESLCDTHEMD